MTATNRFNDEAKQRHRRANPGADLGQCKAGSAYNAKATNDSMLKFEQACTEDERDCSKGRAVKKWRALGWAKIPESQPGRHAREGNRVPE